MFGLRSELARPLLPVRQFSALCEDFVHVQVARADLDNPVFRRRMIRNAVALHYSIVSVDKAGEFAR